MRRAGVPGSRKCDSRSGRRYSGEGRHASACIAYHTFRKSACLHRIKLIWNRGLTTLPGRCYPMEPIRVARVCLHLSSVQKMCLGWSCVEGVIFPRELNRRARFHVIAAPRPSDLPDLDCIQAGLIGGRFFCRANQAESPQLHLLTGAYGPAP